MLLCDIDGSSLNIFSSVSNNLYYVSFFIFIARILAYVSTIEWWLDIKTQIPTCLSFK